MGILDSYWEGKSIVISIDSLRLEGLEFAPICLPIDLPIYRSACTYMETADEGLQVDNCRRTCGKPSGVGLGLSALPFEVPIEAM